MAYGKNSLCILPQVVAKLSDPVDALAVHLYDKLQNNELLRPSSDNMICPYIVDNRAALIFNQYAGIVQRFYKLASEWSTHQAALPAASGDHERFNHHSYRELVSLGHTIVPWIMERYAGDRTGHWHVLLNEIVRHQKTDDSTAPYCDKTSFEQWKKYYEDDRS